MPSLWLEINRNIAYQDRDTGERSDGRFSCAGLWQTIRVASAMMSDQLATLFLTDRTPEG